MNGAPRHEPTQSNETATPTAEVDLWVGDHVEVANMLTQDLTEEFGIAPVFDLGSLWVYEQRFGVWVKLRREELSQRVQAYSGKAVAGPKGPKPLRLKHSDVVGVILTAYEKLYTRDFFENAPAGIAFENGFLVAGADGVKLLPHSPKNRATMKLDFTFDPSAAAPRFQQFLRDIFRGDADLDEKIALLQEHAGASLLGIAARYQLAVVLFGPGGNGKSTYIDVITSVFPKEWRASIAPHAWGHEYNRSLLPGIRLNAVNELPDRELMASEMIKAIISGDEVQARVIREQPFTFRPIAGQIFATNDLPPVTDQSHGLWRRFALISNDRMFKDSEMVRGLAESIAQEEQAGIINWMLEGAQRLMQRDHYKIPASSESIKAAWKRAADSVASFLDDDMKIIEKTDNGLTAEQLVRQLGYTQASDAYTLYTLYCRGNGFKAVSSRKFSERLKALRVDKQELETANWYGIKSKPTPPPDQAKQEPEQKRALPLVN